LKKIANLDRKQILDIEDICTLTLDKNIKSVIKHVPVMITDTIPASGNQVRYEICTMHGYLAGTFHRSQLVHRAGFTSTIMNINTNEDEFMKDLAVADAARHFKNCTGCSCTKNCAVMSRCSCRKVGLFCTTARHKGRGRNQRCKLLSPPGDDTQCTPIAVEHDDGKLEQKDKNENINN
jgi:hypothetical protein